MRIPSGLLCSLFAALAACTTSASREPIAPEAPVARPDVPADAATSSPSDDAPADDGSANAECPGPDIGEPRPDACTEMGCYSGLHLSVRPSDAWPHGDYRYVLDLDGRTVTCEGSLPLKRCGIQSMTCSDAAVTVVESGCALDASTHAFGDVQISDAPSRVHLTIEHDGKAIADADFTPKYRRVQPNGPGCGPVCCQAADQVTLAF